MGTDSMTFGPGLVRLGDDIDITAKVNELITAPEDYDSPAFTFTKTASFEFDSSFNVPLLKELAGELSKPQPFYMEFDGVYHEQVRKHKKKRINKKWAKRYGYREVPCRYRMENAYIRQETFNDFNVVADPPKIIMRYI